MQMSRRRLLASTVMLVACVTSRLGAQRSAPVTLENRAIRIQLDARDGQLIELVDKGNRKSSLTGARDSIGLWQLHLRTGADTTTISAARATRFRSSRVASGLQLVRERPRRSDPSLRSGRCCTRRFSDPPDTRAGVCFWR